MDYEFIKKVKAERVFLDRFYDECETSRRYCRVRPNDSGKTMRTALEKFVDVVRNQQGELDIKSVSINPRRMSDQDRFVELGKNLNYLKDKNYIRIQDFYTLNGIREATNKVVHGQNDFCILDAINWQKDMHEVFSSYFNNKQNMKDTPNPFIKPNLMTRQKYGSFDTLIDQFLPIGDYEVVALIPKQDYEASYGEYNYLVNKPVINIFNQKTYEWAIIRAFKNTSEHERREIRLMQSLWENSNSDLKGIIRGNIMDNVSKECNLVYLVYKINENTQFLNTYVDDRINSSTPLNLEECLSISAQVSDAAIELNDAVNGDLGIYNRTISPFSIFITPKNNGLSAKLGFLETAKLDFKGEDSNQNKTVFHQYIKSGIGAYIPRFLQIEKDLDTDKIDWESVVVYSIVMTMAYMVGALNQTGSVNFDLLLNINDDLFDIVDEFSKMSISSRYSLTDLKKRIEGVRL